jgi:hypothetical protein
MRSGVRPPYAPPLIQRLPFGRRFCCRCEALRHRTLPFSGSAAALRPAAPPLQGNLRHRRASRCLFGDLRDKKRVNLGVIGQNVCPKPTNAGPSIRPPSPTSSRLDRFPSLLRASCTFRLSSRPSTWAPASSSARAGVLCARGAITGGYRLNPNTRFEAYS